MSNNTHTTNQPSGKYNDSNMVVIIKDFMDGKNSDDTPTADKANAAAVERAIAAVNKKIADAGYVKVITEDELINMEAAWDELMVSSGSAALRYRPTGDKAIVIDPADMPEAFEFVQLGAAKAAQRYYFDSVAEHTEELDECCNKAVSDLLSSHYWKAE